MPPAMPPPISPIGQRMIDQQVAIAPTTIPHGTTGGPGSRCGHIAFLASTRIPLSDAVGGDEATRTGKTPAVENQPAAHTTANRVVVGGISRQGLNRHQRDQRQAQCRCCIISALHEQLAGDNKNYHHIGNICG